MGGAEGVESEFQNFRFLKKFKILKIWLNIKVGRNANSIYISVFRKQNRLKGFAIKQMEKQCPTGLRNLRKWYNWANDRDTEYGLLKDIVQSY